MIPYNAVDVGDPTRSVPWTNIGLIVVNFLFFFYELALGGFLTGLLLVRPFVVRARLQPLQAYHSSQ